MTNAIILPTEYKGITFRSRTEARWAVMFERMGIVWNYEPEGHGLDGRGYLPDFCLPELETWFEVKPDKTDGSEIDVFRALVRSTGKQGIIAYGPPSQGREHLMFYGAGGDEIGPLSLAEDRRNDGVYWLTSNSAAFVIGGPGTSTMHDRPPMVSGRPIEEAFEAARAERFGH